jgi:DNA-binding transcriptional LysR family regulator
MVYGVMDVEALRTFLAVNKHRSFSRASRDLHLTQPAVSVRIRILEQALGAPLFERTAGGITLSAAGQTLLPYAERALAAIQDAENAVRDTREGTGGPVALAMVGTLAGPALTRVLYRFAAEHRGVELSLRTARSVEVGQLVRRGEATIGVRYHRDRLRDLEWTEIGVERLFVVCSPAHARAGRRVKTLAALRDERWIGFPESAGQSDIATSHVFGLFLAEGLGEVSWSPVDSLTAQKRLVEGGFGIALMPEANVREELAHGAIRTIRVDNLRASMSVYAVTRTGGFLSPAAKRLRELLSTEYQARS